MDGIKLLIDNLKSSWESCKRCVNVLKTQSSSIELPFQGEDTSSPLDVKLAILRTHIEEASTSLPLELEQVVNSLAMLQASDIHIDLVRKAVSYVLMYRLQYERSACPLYILEFC